MVGHHWMKARISAEPFREAAPLLHKEHSSAAAGFDGQRALDNATAVESCRARGYEQVCWTHHRSYPNCAPCSP